MRVFSVGSLHQGFRFAWENSTIPSVKRLFGDEGFIVSETLNRFFLFFEIKTTEQIDENRGAKSAHQTIRPRRTRRTTLPRVAHMLALRR